MNNPLPPTEELRLLDGELAWLEARRSLLLTRRAWLVQLIQTNAGAVAGPDASARHAAAQRGRLASGAETSAPSAQNLLLALGGVLLTVAATVFTVISWGHLGIGGRAAVLAVLTLAAMAIPLGLLARGLRSTAEAVACLGLVLLVLDAYALHHVALPDTAGAGYWACATAAVSALWTAYGWSLRRWSRREQPQADASTAEGAGPRTGDTAVRAAAGLTLPFPFAVIVAQLPLPLWAVAAEAGPRGFSAAFLATAVADIALAFGPRRTRRAAGRTAVVVSAAAAMAVGGAGSLTALWLSVTAERFGGAAEAGALLLVGAVLAVVAARRTADTADTSNTSDTAASGAAVPDAAVPGPAVSVPAAPAIAVSLATISGLAAIAAGGGVAAVALPAGWTPFGYLLCGVAVLAGLLIPLTPVAAAARAAARRPEPDPRGRGGDPVRRGLAVAAALAHGGALAWTIPAVVTALLAPARRIDRVWAGAPAKVSGWIGPWDTWPDTLAVPAIMLTVAAVLWSGAAIARGGRLGAAAACGGYASTLAAGVVLPLALHLSYPLAVIALAGLATALAVGAARAGTPVVVAVASGCAGIAALTTVCYGLAERPATFAVLGALLAVHVAVAALSSGRIQQTVSAATAVMCATGLAVAIPAAAGLPAHQVAFGVLLVPAAAAFLAAGLEGHSVTARPVEIGGWVAAALAIGLAGGHAPALATVLALTAVVAAGTALRADRRPAAYASAVLFVLATWVRLAASGVDVPEAYTLPVTIPALIVGLLRRRGNANVGSWSAYGPGLAATVLPSLVVAWGDQQWQRPLLLGLAALAITLVGAARRLQAPLLLGGGVLAADALHELTPYVVQVVDALPRWLPPALAGLLLLGVGATYERRLREARRLRDALGRMS